MRLTTISENNIMGYIDKALEISYIYRTYVKRFYKNAY